MFPFFVLNSRQSTFDPIQREGDGMVSTAPYSCFHRKRGGERATAVNNNNHGDLRNEDEERMKDK